MSDSHQPACVLQTQHYRDWTGTHQGTGRLSAPREPPTPDGFPVIHIRGAAGRGWSWGKVGWPFLLPWLGPPSPQSTLGWWGRSVPRLEAGQCSPDQLAPVCRLSSASRAPIPAFCHGAEIGVGPGPPWVSVLWGGDPLGGTAWQGPQGGATFGVCGGAGPHPRPPSPTRDPHRHTEFSQKVIQQTLDPIPKFAYKDLYL